MICHGRGLTLLLRGQEDLLCLGLLGGLLGLLMGCCLEGRLLLGMEALHCLTLHQLVLPQLGKMRGRQLLKNGGVGKKLTISL